MEATEYKTRYFIVTPEDLEEQRYQDEMKRKNLKVDPRTIPSWKPNEKRVADRRDVLLNQVSTKSFSSSHHSLEYDDDDDDLRKMKFRQSMDKTADILRRAEKWNSNHGRNGSNGTFATGSSIAQKQAKTPSSPTKSPKSQRNVMKGLTTPPKTPSGKSKAVITNGSFSVPLTPKTPSKKPKASLDLKSSDHDSSSNGHDLLRSNSHSKISGKNGKAIETRKHIHKHDKSKEGKRKCPLYKLLNINPLDDGAEIDEVALNKVLDDHPELCENFYHFDALSPTEDDKTHLGEVILLNKDWLHPLHMACCVGVSFGTFKKMYKLYPNAVDYISEENGYSVLHCACMYTRAPLKVVNHLIKQDESLQELSCTTMNFTPLHLACAFSPANECFNSDVILLLTEKNKTPTSMVDVDGNTPLHLACMVDSPCLAVVEDLTVVNPSACSEKSKDTGSTPLHHACSNKNANDKDSEVVDVIKELIKTDVSALRVRNKKGQIPIFCAVASSACVVVLKTLVRKYPESLTETNKRGQNPHKFAKYMKTLSKEAVEFLYPYEDVDDESSTSPDTDDEF